MSECISDDFNLLCVLHLSYSNHFSNMCIVGGSTNPYRNGSVARVKLEINTRVKILQSAQLYLFFIFFNKESHESYITTLSPQWNNIQTEKA